jgi:hypothetical protein
MLDAVASSVELGEIGAAIVALRFDSPETASVCVPSIFCTMPFLGEPSALPSSVAELPDQA